MCIRDNYNNTEEEGVGADTPDSLDNIDDTGAFPSDFSCWTSFWLVFLILSLLFTGYLVFLSFKQESLTASFLFSIIAGMVGIVKSAIEFIKGLFRDKIAEDNRRSLLVIAEEIRSIRRIDERRLFIEEENRRTQSSHCLRPRFSSL